MLSNVKKKLIEYEHSKPKRPQHCPYPPDTINLLDKDEKKFVQQVIDSFRFYARAIDMTILLSLNAIASAQAAPK